MPEPITRVIQIHTRYRHPGGEDRVVEAERGLLERGGVEVRQLVFDNADLTDGGSIRTDLALAATAVWSRSAARLVAAEIRARRPDVVHVHNTFVAASPSVLRVAHAAHVPVVHTLHNYRMVCPAATLFRDGRPCTDCRTLAIAAPAIVHRCVRASRAQSLITVASMGIHRSLRTYTRSVDAYIALTNFQRHQVAAALPVARIHVVPNFLDPLPVPGPRVRSGVLFVGRLAAEKGIECLLGAATAVPGIIEIAGDGPLADRVRSAAARGEVHYLGALPPDQIAERMRHSAAVVVPSIWYEGFPLVVLEAYAAGTPVIASNIGSLGEVVEDGVTGFLVEPGDGVALGEAITRILAHPLQAAAAGLSARDRLEQRYGGGRHLVDLLGVYRAAREHVAPRIGHAPS